MTKVALPKKLSFFISSHCQKCICSIQLQKEWMAARCLCNKYSSLERMDDCNYSVKKTPCLKQWMVQADPPEEVSMFERMNDRQQTLS